MNTATELTSSLDPRAVEVLKRKVIAGEISPELFKNVLRRQFIKQIDKKQSRWFLNLMKYTFSCMSGALQNTRGAIRITSHAQAQPSLSKDEMISIVRRRRL